MNTKMPCLAQLRCLNKGVRLKVNNIKRRLCRSRVFFCVVLSLCLAFLCFAQVLCKLLAKGFANKTMHDIMHAGAWRGEAFLYTRGELGLCIYIKCLSTKLKLLMNTKMPCLAQPRRLYKSVRLQVNNIKRRLCRSRAFFCAVLSLCLAFFMLCARISQVFQQNSSQIN